MKNVWKVIIALALVLCVSFTLIACGGDDTTDNGGGNAPSSDNGGNGGNGDNGGNGGDNGGDAGNTLTDGGAETTPGYGEIK